ncbi:MAG: endonuclease V [PVC group bacterium]
MIACVDAHYREDRTVVACVLIGDWTDRQPAGSLVCDSSPGDPYRPGRFYRRELSPLLTVIEKAASPLDAVIIDGYVWLDERGTPGLGGHLYRAMRGKIPVIGVAKTRFQNDNFSCRVFRGKSRRPLYITAAGIPREEAAAHIRAMHGPYRIPAMLREADRLSRE